MMRVVLLLALVLACSSKSGEPDRPPEPVEHAEPGASAPIQVSAKVAKDAGIQVARVQMATLPDTVDLVGEVAADPDHVAQVSVRVGGRIVEVRFREGDTVRAGQTLAVIESSQVARVRAELAAAATRADAAHKKVDRLAELVKAGTASAQDLETARAEAGALDADLAAAHETLASMGTGAGATARFEIHAPLTGVITKRDAVLGQPVAADHVVAEVMDLDHALFVAHVFEHDLARVRVGASAEVTLDAFADAPLVGKVLTVGRTVEPSSRAVLARIAIDDRDGMLRVGLFGTARVEIPEPAARAPVPVVPTAALARVDDQDTVFVETAPGTFVARSVTLGHAVGGKVEVVSGLTASDRVATAGIFTLKSLELKATFGEED